LFHELGAGFTGSVDAVVSAQSIEGFWGRELSYAYLRNVEFMPEPFYERAVGSECGDTGAAAGAVALVRAIDGLYAHPGARARDSALVYGVSDHGAVGGCVLVPA